MGMNERDFGDPEEKETFVYCGFDEEDGQDRERMTRQQDGREETNAGSRWHCETGRVRWWDVVC